MNGEDLPQRGEIWWVRVDKRRPALVVQTDLVRVPRVMSSAVRPSAPRSRVAISSAALFVNVTAQIRSGASWRLQMTWWTRPIKQYVFPAPGPAMTRTGPSGASIA